MKKNLLHNPIFIFFLFIATAIVTTLSSVHFFSIMLAGIVFLSFMKSLKNRYYYSLFFMILAFMFIEYNNGFKPFSLVLLAFFSYLFIIPYINRVISLHNLNNYFYIVWFYFAMILVWIITEELTFSLIGMITFNVFIDIILFGVFL